MNQTDTRKCPECAEEIRAEAIKCRFCGASVGAGAAPAPTQAAPATSTGRRIATIIAAVVVIFLGLGVLSQMLEVAPATTPTGAVSLPQSPLAAAPVVTRAEYDQIREGMTYAQVRTIIGAAGEELSRSNIAGITTVMYSWSNSNGSNMNAMFQNDALIQKAQFGLP